MRLYIADEVLRDYPGAHIGWIFADVIVERGNAVVEAMKENLPAVVRDYGLEAGNLSQHPRIAAWRRIYGDMGVKPSSYRCSLEALLRRIVKGQGMWSVSSVVDCYNCVSVMTMLPMGAYDAGRIAGDLALRYGKEGEVFLPLGSGNDVTVQGSQVVYADEEKVCCWLWNHRDSRECAVTGETGQAFFFVDAAAEQDGPDVEKALPMLSENLERIGCRVLTGGILDGRNPHAQF